MNAGGEGRKQRITTATGRKPRSPPVQTTDQSQPDLKLANGIELIKSAWSDMKEKERELNKMRTENQYLRKTLDELHRNIIDGDRMSQRESKALSDMLDDQLIKAVEAITKEVTQKFDETKAELDYTYNRINALFTRMDVQVILSQKVKNKIAVQGGTPQNNVQITEQSQKSLQLNKDLEVIETAWEEMKGNEREAEYTVQLLEELNKYSGDEGTSISLPKPPLQNAGSNEGKKRVKQQNDEKPRSGQDEQMQKNFESALGVLVKLRETNYAARLLEELNKYSMNDANLDTTASLTKPPIETARAVNNDKRKEDKKPNDDKQISRHQEQLMRNFISASIVLEKLRLSEQVGLAVTHENPAITDLSDPNRPTKLAEQYSELHDNQWTDAFEILSKHYPNKSDIKLTGLLYGMLVDSYDFCGEVRNKQKQALEDIILYPADSTQSSQGRKKTEDINRIFAKTLSDAAKLSANVTGANIAKIFLMSESTKEKYQEWTKSCETYLECCVRLCWLMQVQTPPLCFDVRNLTGKPFDKNYYKEYTKGGKTIAFVVWPALFLHENGPTLCKGIAQAQ